jgi:hypothetical protein
MTPTDEQVEAGAEALYRCDPDSGEIAWERIGAVGQDTYRGWARAVLEAADDSKREGEMRGLLARCATLEQERIELRAAVDRQFKLMSGLRAELAEAKAEIARLEAENYGPHHPKPPA